MPYITLNLKYQRKTEARFASVLGLGNYIWSLRFADWNFWGYLELEIHNFLKILGYLELEFKSSLKFFGQLYWNLGGILICSFHPIPKIRDTDKIGDIKA